jgi:hypothetical protein
MEQRERRSLAGDAEAVIRRLPGVSAARVELGDDARIDQVHVLAAPGRTARALVADVIAAIGAELGVTLEPPQVRVALLRQGQTQPGPAPLRARLKVVGLTVSVLREALEARVRLEHEGLTYEGAASGPPGAANGPEVVALATLRAVELFLRSEGVFQLKMATVVTLATQQVALVLIVWAGPEEELFSGAAIVRDDPRDAVVRALLDAVNRLIGWLGAR